MLKVIIELLICYMMWHVGLFLSRRVSIQYTLGFVEYPSISCMQDILWNENILFASQT